MSLLIGIVCTAFVWRSLYGNTQPVLYLSFCSWPWLQCLVQLFPKQQRAEVTWPILSIHGLFKIMCVMSSWTWFQCFQINSPRAWQLAFWKAAPPVKHTTRLDWAEIQTLLKDWICTCCTKIFTIKFCESLCKHYCTTALGCRTILPVPILIFV